MRLDIPEGQSGDWRIEHFEVTEQEAEFENLRAAIGSSGRPIDAGEYTRLRRNGAVVMSNTPAEIRDHSYFRRLATGDVLINGLGLGCAVQMALAKSDVTSVTVIELSPDVICLVSPYFSDPRLTITQADAYEWQPPKGKRWDVVWHDIWDDICADNLEGMKRLHRKYGRRCDWQGSWCREICERGR